MLRSSGRVGLTVGLATAIQVALYACSSADGAIDDAAPAPVSADEGGAGAVEASLARDGTGGGDAMNDAAPDAEAALDGGTDAALDADASADGATDAALDADPGPPRVRFTGRFDTTAPAGPKVAFPHAQILARFSGPEVRASFTDAVVYQDYGPTRWEVRIDGAVRPVLSLDRVPTTYTLAQGLGPEPHTVELTKLTEANVGTTQFLGFEFPGGALLPPPAAAARHLEFLGDSASNGYGIEGVEPCAFTSATENAHLAYPALVAADLGADHHNLGVSGKGLYYNYYRPDLDVFSVVYGRALPYDSGSTFAFGDYAPDVVWMTLGGNDYSRPAVGDPAPPYAAFEARYDEMVALIRRKRPTAHIVCAVAPSITNDYPLGYDAYTNIKTAASSVVAARGAAGDARVYFFEFTRSTPADLTGCLGHPNVAKHRAMADEAVAFLKTKTGW